MRLDSMAKFVLDRKEFWREKSMESDGREYRSCREKHSVECENYAEFFNEAVLQEMFDEKKSLLKSNQGLLKLVFHDKASVKDNVLKLWKIDKNGKETHVWRVFNPTVADLVNKVDLTKYGKQKLGLC